LTALPKENRDEQRSVTQPKEHSRQMRSMARLELIAATARLVSARMLRVPKQVCRSRKKTTTPAKPQALPQQS
jgi:hypothetical protein